MADIPVYLIAGFLDGGKTEFINGILEDGFAREDKTLLLCCEEGEEEYDLIIVDSSDPFGPSEGLFTREFYGSCFNALKEDGIMVNQQGSPFYAEDASAMQRSHKRIASTFPISRVYQAHIPTFAAGYWLFGFASKKYHPIDDLDAESWKALNMRTRYYTTKLHIGAFYLPAFLEEMLREVEEH